MRPSASLCARTRIALVHRGRERTASVSFLLVPVPVPVPVLVPLRPCRYSVCMPLCLPVPSFFSVERSSPCPHPPPFSTHASSSSFATHLRPRSFWRWTAGTLRTLSSSLGSAGRSSGPRLSARVSTRAGKRSSSSSARAPGERATHTRRDGRRESGRVREGGRGDVEGRERQRGREESRQG